MRTYGRVRGVIPSSQGIGIVSAAGVPVLPSGTPLGEQPAVGAPVPVWVEVSTDASGNNDMVYFVTFCQCLLLEPNEDPSFSNYGVPATQAVQNGVAPDYYVARMQAAFAQYFASLTIVRGRDSLGNPVYNVSCMFHNGIVLDVGIPIPF